MTARAILPTMLALAATGCTGITSGHPYGLKTPLNASLPGHETGPDQQYAINRAADPSAAMAWLPISAGRPLELRERRGEGRLSQSVIYPMDSSRQGENRLDVSLKAGSRTGEPPPRAPSEAMIAAEMRRELPRLEMRIDNIMHANAYGPYGHAIGTSGPLRCIYGWQQVRGRKAASRFWQRAGSLPTLSIRLRHCSTAMSEQALVALMQGVEIDADSARLTPEQLVSWRGGHLETPAVAEPARPIASAPPVAESYQPRGVAAAVSTSVAPKPKVRKRKAVARKPETKPAEKTAAAAGADTRATDLAPAVKAKLIVPLPGEVVPVDAGSATGVSPVTALPG